MTRIRRTKTHKGVKHLKKKFRLRRRTKDLDQIHEDLQDGNQSKLMKQEVDPDLPGLGQHYCIPCGRYMISEEALKVHVRGGQHKRRLRQLKEAPYSQEEAERAAGLLTEKKRPISALSTPPQQGVPQTLNYPTPMDTNMEDH